MHYGGPLYQTIVRNERRVAERLLVITFDIVYTFWSSCPSASFFGIVPYCLVKCHTIMAVRISEIAFFFLDTSHRKMNVVKTHFMLVYAPVYHFASCVARSL